MYGDEYGGVCNDRRDRVQGSMGMSIEEYVMTNVIIHHHVITLFRHFCLVPCHVITPVPPRTSSRT